MRPRRDVAVKVLLARMPQNSELGRQGAPQEAHLDTRRLYAYNTYMRVVWDPEKARANVQKHGVRFSDAEGVLFDPGAISAEDKESRGEQRFVSIGRDHVGQILGSLTRTGAKIFA